MSWIVVLYSGDDCEQQPGVPCLQGMAYGPYDTNDLAKEAASTFAPGHNAHVLMLTND